jgi:hypothetical protein
MSATTKTRPAGYALRARGGRPRLWLAARVLGALALLLNFVGATLVGLGLLSPVEHLLGRLRGAILALLSLAGIVQAATAFVFLFISERTPLFGFMEPGYDPGAILAARIAEAATVGFLGAFMWARFLRPVPTSSW